MKKFLLAIILILALSQSAFALSPISFAWNDYVDAALVNGFRLYERGSAEPIEARRKIAEFSGGTTTQGQAIPSGIGERCSC